MQIKSELLWGKHIRKQKEAYELLKNGKLPFGYYLLLATSDGRLEFAPSCMQKNRYFTSDESLIFGVAYQKQEAYEMICDILKQIYVDHVYKSVADYVNMLWEDVC